MKQLLVVMIIAVLGVSTSGQTQSQVPSVGKCSLTVAQSPEIRGIRLGMSAEEVLRLFPGSSDAIGIRSALSQADRQFGVARFGISPDLFATKQTFEGISQFNFEYLDGALTYFYVSYNGPEWKNVDEFISRLSESLKLPSAENWERTNISSSKKLKCEGFEASVFIGGSAGNSNHLLIQSLAAGQIVSNRQTAAKEKARKEFKP